MITVTAIPAFNDNYIWILSTGESAYIVDPGDAEPVIKFLDENRLTCVGILITHWHPDHIGGIDALLEYDKNISLFGPNSEHIPFERTIIGHDDELEVLGNNFSVIAVPGHTLDHIAYFCDDEALLFCGDTLFSAGCGRMFEGTPEQMSKSLNRLAALPLATQVYCAHEYTESNIKFALTVEPENHALQSYAEHCAELRSKNLSTIPSNIKQELAVNPFLRCEASGVINSLRQNELPANNAIQCFASLRQWKDGF